MSRFPHLLSPLALGALPLPNRVVMAPMTRNRARPDGTVTSLHAEYFAQRARAGMVITDAVMSSPQGVGYPRTPGLWTDEQVESWRPVVKAVHGSGGLITLQLMHCGRISLEAFQPGRGAPVSSTPMRAERTMLYSPAWELEPAAEPRALELGEIADVVREFGECARRGREAGFDAVEIHAGDGYLVDQFLRNGVNQRHDRYGGSAENRARFLLEVTEAVAREVSAERTGVRLSPTGTLNEMRDTNPLETFGTALRHLAALDIAWTHFSALGDEDFTHRLRDVYGKPFILNGGFSADAADDVIRRDLACAVSFGRAYIANPDLVERFATDAPLSVADPATFYGGDARGYTDYPTLAEAAALQR
ncbi:MAG TPA: alkene reductase [Gemmatimonadaceae bacterium]|nr:alkene reductase [Gemmatimonadaceae bacterium]